MKVQALIDELQKLNPDLEIGLADEKLGAVEIQAIETDEAAEVYRII